MNIDAQRPISGQEDQVAPPELVEHADVLRVPPPRTTYEAGRVDESRSRVHAEQAAAFSRHIHEYVREYIRLADQKAVFIFAFASALLAFLYQKDAHLTWYRPLGLWTALSPVALVAMVALAVGIGLTSIAMLPE